MARLLKKFFSKSVDRSDASAVKAMDMNDTNESQIVDKNKTSQSFCQRMKGYSRGAFDYVVNRITKKKKSKNSRNSKNSKSSKESKGFFSSMNPKKNSKSSKESKGFLSSVNPKKNSKSSKESKGLCYYFNFCYKGSQTKDDDDEPYNKSIPNNELKEQIMSEQKSCDQTMHRLVLTQPILTKSDRIECTIWEVYAFFVLSS